MSTNTTGCTKSTNNAGVPPEAHERAGVKANQLKLGSSPSLAMVVKLIADFYCTTADRIDLTSLPALPAPVVWAVAMGGKVIESVEVVKQRGRFVFQTK